tara:strand:+ start:61 stop:1389 length:1329 start_codon:yes stop_codon:yes gene_type:complete
MASTYLSKTYGSSGNRQRQTISFWLKRSKLDAGQVVFSSYASGSYYAYVLLKSDNTLNYYNHSNVNIRTNRRFKDTNAWYHIVITLDTTQATESDRVKIYVNGVRETSLQTTTYPAQNAEVKFGDDNLHEIGRHDGGSYLDGYLSHFHFVTNTAYQASTFGSTDATTGEWKINTNPSVTYATNSFFILKDGNSGTDQSGQSNNYSVGGGTLTKSEDNPSNIFATMNPLTLSAAQVNITQGNLAKTNTPTTNAWRTFYGTIGATSGKYYWEIKITNNEPSDPSNMFFGIVSAEQINNTANNSYFTAQSHGYGYHAKTGNVNNNSTSTGNSYGASITTNDILGVAVDLDNNKIYFAKNGTWQNSGVPTSGSTGTGSAFTLAGDITYLPAFAQYYGNEHFAVNMGNGFFGTTAVSSAGTNASGNGIFEYDVPTGYTAMSTKGLNL